MNWRFWRKKPADPRPKNRCGHKGREYTYPCPECEVEHIRAVHESQRGMAEKSPYNPEWIYSQDHTTVYKRCKWCACVRPQTEWDLEGEIVRKCAACNMWEVVKKPSVPGDDWSPDAVAQANAAKELEVEITFHDGTVKVTPASKFWETNREWWVGHIPFSDEHPYTD